MESSIFEIEKQYVHEIYSKIAIDFDKTRYKAWSLVKEFIESIPISQSLADIGSGNCKNLSLFKGISIGVDIIPEFVELGRSKGFHIISGSVIDIPLETASYDNTICIAVIHHLASFERRQKAIEELLRITRPGGKIMIQVWSFEQPSGSRFNFVKGDNYVKWFNRTDKKTYQRYYYIHDQSMFEKLFETFQTLATIEIKYDEGNWVAFLTKL